MIRVLVPPGSLAVGREVELDESEGRHLDVRRLRDGDGAEALDGRGGVGTGILTRRGKGWQFATQIAFLEPEPSPTIIAVGAGDVGVEVLGAFGVWDEFLGHGGGDGGTLGALMSARDPREVRPRAG